MRHTDIASITSPRQQAALDAVFPRWLWRRVRVHFGAPLPRKPYRAMTLGRHIFVREGAIAFSTLAHELGHCVQYARWSIPGFFWRYFWQACLLRRQHADNEVEKESQHWRMKVLKWLHTHPHPVTRP